MSNRVSVLDKKGTVMPFLDEMQLKEVLDTDPYREEREEYVKRMKADGFDIRYPESNELLIDLDSDKAFEEFKVRISRVSYELEVNGEGAKLSYKVYPSKTECHYHVIVTMPFDLDEPFERIALQAVLGSDPVREMLSIFRIWLGDKHPTLLAMKSRQSDANGKEDSYVIRS